MMLSLVIPVYRNAGNLAALLEALNKLDKQVGGDMEVVFVVDGSPDDSLQILARALPHTGFRSQLLSLSRNFGAFSAIRAGLEAGAGECLAVMTADLQEPPELVATFYQKLNSGEVDVVIGVRAARADPLLSRCMSALFWMIYRRFVQPEIPPGGVDVFGCTRDVRDHLLRLPESNSSLVAQLFWVGFRRTQVPYERREREVGRSAWTMAKKFRYLADSVFAFSDLPIRVLFRVGVLALSVSVIMLIVVVLWKIYGAIPVPGYAATVTLVMFFGALNCLGLGIVGGYVWRTFENTKTRPNYIVARRERFAATAAGDSAVGFPLRPAEADSRPNDSGGL